MARSLFSSLEALETRIAPASLAIYHPLPDIEAALGQAGKNINLAGTFDGDDLAGYRTHVVFTTNYDTDPNTPGLQAGQIVLELFDDKAPLTVANFLTYLNTQSGHGTYFNTYFHRTVPGFVLQGGGYSSTSPSQHIAVGAAVHNEYDPTDAERSNTFGTVALARSTLVNSGTSEFFFNLGDNSSGLDNQNGGFTVFAKVVSGMDVVQAIAALPAAAIATTFNTPYQNGYQPDPDLNPATAAPTPAANQLAAITGAKIVPPKTSAVPGISYSLLRVVNDTTGLDSNAITAKVTGNNLALKYGAGQSGIFTVTVRALDTSDPSHFVDEQFQVKLLPNLVVSAVADIFLTSVQSGDTGRIAVQVTNSGIGTAKISALNPLQVSFYLSAVNSADPTGFLLDSSDALIGTTALASALNLAGGKSTLLGGNFTIPDGANLTGGVYRILAKVSTPGNPLLADYYSDDNFNGGANLHALLSGPRGADLVASSVVDNLPSILVPGDTGLAKLTVINQVQSATVGKVDIKFYLSKSTVSPTDTTTTESDVLDPATDLLVGHLDNQTLSLTGGKSSSFVAPVSIPASLEVGEGYYRIYGVVTAADGSTVMNVATANDQVAGAYHRLVHDFGSFGLQDRNLGTLIRTNAVLKYVDEANHLVLMQLAGTGFGSVITAVDGGLVLQIEGASAKTTVLASLRAVDGKALPADTHTTVRDILVNSGTEAPIGYLALGLVDWTDVVSVQGGGLRVTLGNTVGDGDHAISIGASTPGAALRPLITLGSLQDTSLSSLLPIGGLSVKTWLSVNGHDQLLQAPAIDVALVAGDFTADLTVVPTAATSAVVVKSFTVSGAVIGSKMQIGGNVGTLQFGSVASSEVLVGAEFVPQALRDFNASLSVASFTVTGQLSDTNVAATNFSQVKLGSVATENGGSPLGVIAQKIALYQRGTTVLRNLTFTSTTPNGVADAAGDYQATLLTA